jgi:hypothetical protein
VVSTQTQVEIGSDCLDYRIEELVRAARWVSVDDAERRAVHAPLHPAVPRLKQTRGEQESVLEDE